MFRDSASHRRKRKSRIDICLQQGPQPLEGQRVPLWSSGSTWTTSSIYISEISNWKFQIPDERTVTYNRRTIRGYHQCSCRTVRFSNTYCQNTLYEWNLLSDETKDSLSITEFKRKLLRHRLDCLTPMCNCGAEKEANEHFLLPCLKSDLMRANLFGQLSEIPALDIDGMNSNTLCSLLLYGCSQFDNLTNRMILDASILYTQKTKRFQ